MRVHTYKDMLKKAVEVCTGKIRVQDLPGLHGSRRLCNYARKVDDVVSTWMSILCKPPTAAPEDSKELAEKKRQEELEAHVQAIRAQMTSVVQTLVPILVEEEISKRFEQASDRQGKASTSSGQEPALKRARLSSSS